MNYFFQGFPTFFHGFLVSAKQRSGPSASRCFCQHPEHPVVALFSIPGQPPELILAKDPLDSLFGYITNLLDVAMVTDNSRNVIRTIRVQPFTLVFSLFCLSTARPY